MSISVVADGISSSATITIPAHQAGDLIIISARGTSAVPSIPASGGTVPAWIPIQGAVANSVALRTVGFVATGPGHTSGTFTGATNMICTVFRPSAGKLIGIGSSSTGNGNNTQTIIYPALTLTDSDGSSMGFRIGTRGTAIAAVNTAPPSWSQRGASGVPPALASFNRAALVANPVVDSVALTGASNSAYRAHTVEIIESDPPTPANETLIDDFNRADAAAHVGRPDIWASTGLTGAIPYATIRSNKLSKASGTASYTAVSSVRLQQDFDLLVDVVTPPVVGANGFSMYFCVEEAGSAAWDGYSFECRDDGVWTFRPWTNGSWGTSPTFSHPMVAAGDTIWIKKTGTTIICYRRPSGGVFVEVGRVTNALWNRAGFFGIGGQSNGSDILVGLDNLRGGPFVPPVFPLDETLIDDFNRADARVDAGVGSTIWKSAWYDGGVDTDVRVIGNQLGLLAAQYMPAYTLKSVQKDCDVVIDCVAPPVAPNNEFGLYFCMTDTPSSAFDGYAVFWSAGTWILRRYLNGANAGNIATAAGALLAGDSMWISKVGSALKLYKKPSGGNYNLILQATDANHNLPGKIVVELSDTTQRWENLRGGPFVLPSRSVMVI